VSTFSVTALQFVMGRTSVELRKKPLNVALRKKSNVELG
jgi:hypothetical protein